MYFLKKLLTFMKFLDLFFTKHFTNAKNDLKIKNK